jgi:hypothetical protein
MVIITIHKSKAPLIRGAFLFIEILTFLLKKHFENFENFV